MLSVIVKYLFTGLFIMFSVITNTCKKKTKGPTFIDLFTDTGKLKKFFLTTRDFRCVHHGWHNAHRYDIQVLATHTHQHVTQHTSIRYSSSCHTCFNMLTPVWQEPEYRIDVCHVTRGAHIKNLLLSKRSFSVFLWLWTIPLKKVVQFSCYKCL